MLGGTITSTLLHYACDVPIVRHLVLSEALIPAGDFTGGLRSNQNDASRCAFLSQGAPAGNQMEMDRTEGNGYGAVPSKKHQERDTQSDQLQQLDYLKPADRAGEPG